MPKSAEGNPLATKPITITLSATTRLEYAETIEVPADATHAELDALVAQRYDQVDAACTWRIPITGGAIGAVMHRLSRKILCRGCARCA